MKGLTRVDHDGKKMYGWLARVYGGGKTFSKYFSDRKYGGKEKSRIKAVAHLEKLTVEIQEQFKDYIPRQNQASFRRKPGRGNKTGVVGIHRCETVNHGKRVSYWAATWNDDGKPRDKKFYFGNAAREEDEAHRMALEWRAKKVVEMSTDENDPVLEWLEQDKPRQKKTDNKLSLKNWVPGLEITDWRPGTEDEALSQRDIKRRERFSEKRIRDLVLFMGISATLFDWHNIDYEFGRGIFKGDVRSRCFWNSDGYRTDVLVDSRSKIIFIQGSEPDEYYLDATAGLQQAMVAE